LPAAFDALQHHQIYEPAPTLILTDPHRFTTAQIGISTSMLNSTICMKQMYQHVLQLPCAFDALQHHQ
jgi:hypothetical protein